MNPMGSHPAITLFITKTEHNEPERNLSDPKELNGNIWSSSYKEVQHSRDDILLLPQSFGYVKACQEASDHLCQQHLHPRTLTAVYTAPSKNWKGWARMSTQRRNFWLQAAFHLGEEEGKQKKKCATCTRAEQAGCLSKDVSWQASHSL